MKAEEIINRVEAFGKDRVWLEAVLGGSDQASARLDITDVKPVYTGSDYIHWQLPGTRGDGTVTQLLLYPESVIEIKGGNGSEDLLVEMKNGTEIRFNRSGALR